MPRRSSVLLALVGLATLGSSGCFLFTAGTFRLMIGRPWERASEVAVTRRPDGVYQVHVRYADGAGRTLLWSASDAEPEPEPGARWGRTPDERTWRAEPNGVVARVGEPVEVLAVDYAEAVRARTADPPEDGLRWVEGRTLELIADGRPLGQLPIDRREGRHSTPFRLLIAITLPFALVLDLVTAPLQPPALLWAFLASPGAH